MKSTFLLALLCGLAYAVYGQNFGPVTGVTTAATDLTNATIPAANVDAGNLQNGVNASGPGFTVGVSTLAVVGGKVGVGTNAPAATLDVNGSAQFGSGATKSTFTATGALTLDPGAPLTVSSATFVGVSVSTQAAGAAGAAVTAKCKVAGTFAIGGGCDCSGAVSITEVDSTPNCLTAGCIPTGWTCQEPGGTGGACIAYVICSRLQ